MGACFDSFKANTSDPKIAIDMCRDYIDDCLYMNGHGGYTGTMAECRGVVMSTFIASSAHSAYEYLIENCDKWGPAEGVRVEEDGAEPYYLFGALCSS